MIVYYFQFFLFLISGIPKNKFWRNSINLIIGLFFCSGYMVGSDWRAYELMYLDIDSSNILIYYSMYEPIFTFLVFFLKSVGIDFWIYTISVKFICYWIFINTINKYTYRNFYFISAVLFLGIVLPFLFIDCPFRNLISITIFLYSIRFIESKNLLIYSLLSILALGFHLTSIIMIPVYFIINRKINNYIFIVLYMLSFIFFFFPEVVFIILTKLFSYNEFILKNIISYSETDGYSSNTSLFSFGIINRIILFFLIIYSRKFIFKTSKNGNLIFNFSMLYFISTNIAFAVPILSRVTYFFVIFFIICVANIINKFNVNSRKIYAGYLIFFSFFTINKTITSKKDFIPYSNYFIHKFILDENDSYEFRESYNSKNSPYNKN